jgi:hypothetical protein
MRREGEVFETYRMLGQEREAELRREAVRLQRAALAPRNARWGLLGVRMSTVRRLAAVTVLIALVLAGALAQTGASAAAARTVNCADAPYNNRISGLLEANLEITVHGSVCLVTGTVTGNVTVRNEDPQCDTRPPFVALDLEGGAIEGNVKAAGRRCVMVWLVDNATVSGNVIYEAEGNLGFLGDLAGATVRGNVLLKDGLLWATGASASNRVDGNLVCNGGEPLGGLDSGSDFNWDGADGDLDGTIGGAYLGC